MAGPAARREEEIQGQGGGEEQVEDYEWLTVQTGTWSLTAGRWVQL